MIFRAVLFDLDGTLLDTLRDIADSMNAALEQFGLPVHPIDSYKKFVGGGIDTLARMVLPESNRPETLVRALSDRMAAEYSNRWKDNTAPYPGVRYMLDGLTGKGARLAILSNKPDDFTKKMRAHYLGRWEFEVVLGAHAGIPKKPDPEAALRIAGDMRLAPENFLYLGDSGTDMITARAAGMYPVGALWGFRDADELAANGAATLIKKPEEILALFQ
jgi:phosphoglycolate phosphatase